MYISSETRAIKELALSPLKPNFIGVMEESLREL
jgi:hypothetical protein